MPRLSAHKAHAWSNDRFKRFRGHPAFVPSNPFDETKPDIAGNAKTSRDRKGNMTNLERPAYPRVFRKFGMNTRATVYPLPNTGILDNKYDPSIFNTGKGHSSLIPSERSTHLGQGGATQDVLGALPSLSAGSHHWLFSTGSSKHG